MAVIANLDALIAQTLGKAAEAKSAAWFLPKPPFRAIILGTTGSGKTTLVLNLLLRFMEYDQLFVVAKMLEEEKYEFLDKLFERLAQKCKVDKSDLYQATKNLEDLPSIDDFPNDGKTRVVVFDDLISEKDQKKVEEYFTRGRKKLVNELYVAHGYSEVPKMIRKMADLYIIFPQKAGDRRSIHRDLVSGDMDIAPFHKLMKMVGQRERGRNFLVIDRNAPPETRYRIGFDDVVVLGDS